MMLQRSINCNLVPSIAEKTDCTKEQWELDNNFSPDLNIVKFKHSEINLDTGMFSGAENNSDQLRDRSVLNRDEAFLRCYWLMLPSLIFLLPGKVCHNFLIYRRFVFTIHQVMAKVLLLFPLDGESTVTDQTSTQSGRMLDTKQRRRRGP